MFTQNPISLLRMISLIEGVSFLLLVGVAMPLKYLAHVPQPVKYVGWAHGVLFITLLVTLLYVWITMKWKITRAMMVAIAALLPFGPFVIDRRLKQYASEYESVFVAN